LGTRPLFTADGAMQMAAWQTSLSATINSGGSMYDDGQLRVRADLRALPPVFPLYKSTCHNYC